MAKIRFETGQVVNFDGTPTAADVEEIASKLGARRQQPARPPAQTISPADAAQQQKYATKFIPQFTKGLYEEAAFGKRAIGALPHAERIRATQETIPEPIGLKAKIGRAAGRIIPQIAMSAPFLSGAGAIPRIPQIAKTAIGLGAYGGARAKAQGDPVLPAAAGGAGAGLAFGGLGKLGAAAKKTRALQQFLPKTQRVSNIVKEGINKAIRPSVVGKKTAPQIGQYHNKAKNAVTTILENKKNLQFTDELGNKVNRLPESLDDFLEAIHQTKSSVFSKYDNLLTQTGKKGVGIDVYKLSPKLNAIVNNKALAIKDPATANYARQIQERLNSFGRLGIKETDELIKAYNSDLKIFYDNPTYGASSKATVDSLVVNNLRSMLDKTVNAATGREFQVLKNQYGSLKALENDVARRAIVYNRKNVKGLIDYMDVFAIGDAIKGIITKNPAHFAKGAAQYGVKRSFKRANDANLIIKKMFKEANKFHEPYVERIIPEVLTDVRTLGGLKQGALPFRGAQQRALPSPRNVPYSPPGYRNVGQKPIILPTEQGGATIIGQNPQLRLPSPQTVGQNPMKYGKWFTMR